MNAVLDWRKGWRLMVFLAVAAVILMMLAMLYHALLTPICLSLLFTYLFVPLVDRLDTKYRIDRGIAAAFIIVVIMGCLGVVVAFLAPAIYREGVALGRLAPSAVRFVIRDWLPLVKDFLTNLTFIDPLLINRAIQEFDLATQMSSTAGGAMSTLWSATPSFVFGLVNVVLLPVISFFLLRDIHQLNEALAVLVPRDLLSPLRQLLGQMHETVRTILRGQLMVACILGVLYIIGLSLAGLSYSLAIGAVAGFCRIVPYLDIVVGVALSAIVIVSDFAGWYQVLWVAVVFLFVQVTDGMLITPRILGGRAGLHPGIIMVSIIAFGDRFGFYGILLAVPAIALIKVLGKALTGAYQRSPWYDPMATTMHVPSMLDPIRLPVDHQDEV